MEKERIIILAQLLTGMKDVSSRIESALKKQDAEELARAKKELLYLQAQIKGML